MPKPSGQRREAPVSFRPGKLRSAIRQRAVRDGTEGQIVKRDLGRYYLLLGQALADVRLTRREATWLAATEFQHYVDQAISGDPFVPEHEHPSDYLLRLVKRRITQEESRGQPADKVAYRIADKVEAMTSLQRAALVDALDRLPIQAEEEIYDPGNWALIGVPLVDEPLTVEDIVSDEGH
jgi:hypothetical protein